MAQPAVRIAQHRSGGVPRVENKTVKAAETFVAGDALLLYDEDEVGAAGDDPAAVYGFALADAVDDKGTLRATVPVAVADGNTIFSAVNKGAAYVAATHLGEIYEYEESGGAGAGGVGLGTAGNAVLTVMGVDPGDSTRILVAVEAANSQAQGYGTAALT